MRRCTQQPEDFRDLDALWGSLDEIRLFSLERRGLVTTSPVLPGTMVPPRSPRPDYLRYLGSLDSIPRSRFRWSVSNICSCPDGGCLQVSEGVALVYGIPSIIRQQSFFG